MRRRHHNKRKLIQIIAVIVIAIVVIGAAVFFIERGTGKSNSNNTERELQRIAEQTLYFGDDEYTITHNVEAYLLIGTDDSGNIEAEGTRNYRGQMADVLLLLVLDRTDETYGILQINRDTMTEVPLIDTKGNGEGEALEQICIAHWYGGSPEAGCDNTVFTVSELLGGLEISGYYSINMSDIGTLNHAVGGVEVTIQDDLTKADKQFRKGATLTLTDKQANEFVRARMNVGDEDNTQRMNRQMQFMQGFKSKAFQKMGEDPEFINALLEELEADAVTDMPNNRWSVIANQVYKSEDLGILTYDGTSEVNDTLGDGELHAEFYADEQSIIDALVTLCGIQEEDIRIDQE